MFWKRTRTEIWKNIALGSWYRLFDFATSPSIILVFEQNLQPKLCRVFAEILSYLQVRYECSGQLAAFLALHWSYTWCAVFSTLWQNVSISPQKWWTAQNAYKQEAANVSTTGLLWDSSEIFQLNSSHSLFLKEKNRKITPKLR